MSVTTLPASKTSIGLTPQNLDEAMRFADLLSQASIIPKDYQGNPGNVLVAIQWGAEIGLAPLQALQNIAVINGRPAIWGDSMLALVRGSGLLVTIVEEFDDTAASCTVQRHGEAPVTRTFTLEDAKRGGLAGKPGPWQQYTRRMLQMRARAWALRDVFTDVLRGVWVAEEAQDIPAEKDVTAECETIAVTCEPPKSRAEGVRKALDRQKTPAMPPPDLQDILSAISAADSEKTLKAAARWAGELTDEADKQEARSAYARRKAELAALSVDPDTGEIAGPPEPQHSPAYLDWLTDIESLDNLAGIAHAIRAIKKAEGLAESETIQLLDVLKQRQAVIKADK